jgi:two-component system nitrate/nitrite response regulator NarL
MTRGLGATRVAIVEDHTLFAESLDVALTFEGHDVRRVAPGASRCVTLGAILTTVLHLHPKVVLLDLGLGAAGSGLPLVEPLTRAGSAVVVVTGSSDRVEWGECLRSGASTVMSKSQPLNDILAAIRHLGEGRAVMSRATRDELTATFLRDRSERHELRRHLETLTPREREVLGQLMYGRTVREIATSSVVSEATVRTQVKSILAKLHVSSQLAAVGMAHRVGGLPSDTVA